MTTLQDIMGLITKRKIKTPSDNDYIISAAYTDTQERLKPQPKMEANLLNIGALKKYIQNNIVLNLQQVTDLGASTTNSITANSFVKTGGSGTEYLMANGSITTAPYKYNFGGSVSWTGTTNTENLLTITIPANSLTDYLDIRSIMVQQSGPALGGLTIRVWHNTVNNFNTATRIANFAYGTATADLFAQIARRFSIQSGQLLGFSGIPSNVTGEGANINAALSIPFNTAAINYLFISVQLNNALDTATLRNVNIIV